MQSGFTPLLKSSRNQLRVMAAGCAATGGVAVLLLPGVAQSPASTPSAKDSKAKNSSTVAPLPAMVQSKPDIVADPNSNFVRKAVPKTRSLAQMQAEAMKINIEFRDVPVSELLAMVAMQGDSNISIGSDVDPELKIPYIRLNDVTPAEAIADIADSAGLKWLEKGPNKFFVGKILPNAVKVKPIRAVPVFNQEIPEQNIFEPQIQSVANSKQPGTPFESLVGLSNNKNNKNGREEREIRPVRVRNVRPGIIAWWIDAQHHEVPIEFKKARENFDKNTSPYMMSSGVDPAVYAQLNNRNTAPTMPFATAYAPSAYANPYASPVAANYLNAIQPNYRTNYQFGGFGQGQQQGQQGFGQQGQQGFGQQGQQGGLGFGGGVLQLPEEVDQLVAIDSQNVLLVYGTAAGIAQLQTIIDYLDRPIRQVEIEAQFIDVSVNESRAFGVQFFNRNSSNNSDTDDTDTDGDGNPDNNDNVNNGASGGGIGAGIPGANQLTISYGQYQAQLNFLSQKGNSRIINSPRITTMNNLSANLQSSQITPILLTSANEGIGGQVGETQQAFFLTTSVGLQVTPTINNDDTITVFMTPFVQTQVPTPGLTTGGTSTGDDDDDDDDDNNNNSSSGGSSIPTVLAQSLTTVANVKDNDVIVLGGLRTRTESVVNSRIPILSRLPLIGRLFRSTNRTDIDRELVIFLTARIQRRTDDVTPFLGP